MISHVLGYSTLVVTALLSGVVTDWLWRTGTRPYTWQRAVRAPKIEAEPSYSDDPSVGVV